MNEEWRRKLAEPTLEKKIEIMRLAVSAPGSSENLIELYRKMLKVIMEKRPEDAT